MFNKINISLERQKLIVCFVLIVVTFAVFWQMNQFDFINFDDTTFVTENRYVQSDDTLERIRWAFTTTCGEFWQPLVWFSLMFDYQLYGMNAGGFHLTNLIIHIMSTLLLFWLFNRMTGAIWRSAFIAAFFALHPLHVESVAWVTERKDVLSAFFWMLTLCLYVYYTEKPVISRYLLILLSFTCGLMSKSMVVTLPVVMILLDYWPLGRLQSDKKQLSEVRIAGIIPLWQLKEKIPFFIFSAAFSLITIYAQYGMYIKRPLHPLGLRIANAPVFFVNYLGKIFWPHDLALGYPSFDQTSVWQVVVSVLLILFISAAVIAAVKRLPYLFVGFLWYAITVLPVIGIIPVGDPMADRYVYLPSIGITIMLVWGVLSLIKSEYIREKILFPTGIAALAILAVLSWQQCGYWKNSITIFSRTLQVTKNNFFAHNQRGSAYGAVGQYQLAIEDFSGAIRLKPDFAEAYSNRGNVYNKLGQYQLAIENYNEAIRLKPDLALAYNNRGLAYLAQGNKSLGCLSAQMSCAMGVCTTLEMAKSKGYCL